MAEKLKIAFMGTPDFAVPALDALIHSENEVVCVYTQPPRPKGRGHKVWPSPVHETAQAHNIPVYTPRSLKKDQQAQEALFRYEPDVIVVAAYGLMLPKNVLEGPRFGALNIHASLLPRWRGAAPIQYAIWKGDEKSGISIMRMEEGLDSGPVIAQKELAIRPQTTAQSLHDEMAALGAAMIDEVLRQAAENGALDTATPQDAAQVTYAPMLRKEDGRVSWAQSAAAIDRQIRALNPWPGVWALTGNEMRLKILAAEPVSEEMCGAPGFLADNAGHVVCGHDTALRLITVQPENARAMDFSSAINGGYLKPDSMLE